jgi:arginine repressor
MDKATIDKAKAENPTADLRLLKIETNDGLVEILVKIPNDGEWKRFRDMQANDEQGAAAVRQLVLASVVVPDAAGFAAMLSTRPGLAESVAKPLIKLAGVSAIATVEKV